MDFKKVRSIAIFIFPNVDEFDFVGVYEVLGNANRMIEEERLQLDESLQVDRVFGWNSSLFLPFI